MILTAGPWITDREREMVARSVNEAWNEGAYKFIHEFADKLGKYTKRKYVQMTASGTTALGLAFSTIGLSKGDEVIVPDLCYFSPLDEIVFRGAKPVFVDVLADTWCIDPSQIEKAITKRTKAIMPVYMYGHLTEAEEIRAIADKYNLYVIDDACPAMGSRYKTHHAGHLSDISCFSFQGAKIMTTGFGGALTTNNKKLFERASFLNWQGQKGPKFWQIENGYSYDISDFGCAFGIAQLERLDEMVEKKRLINKWYREEFTGIDLWFQTEKPYTRANYWMSSVVPLDSSKKYQDKLRAYLKKEGIDTRPIFYPASMFPMYKEAKTPISHEASYGINLPSGHHISRSQVEYIASKVIKFLYGKTRKNAY